MDSQLVDRVCSAVDSGRATVGAPVSPEVIAAVEAEVGVLPGEYRAFLVRFGWLRVDDVDVLGVGGSSYGVVEATVAERGEDLEWPLARNFLVVSEIGNGDVVCVDMVTLAVVLVVHDEVGVSGRAVRPLAASFGEWLGACLDEAESRPVDEGWVDLDAVVESAVVSGVEVGLGVSDGEIVEAERMIGAFPDSYRRFLLRCGWMRHGNQTVNGLGEDVPDELDVIAATLRQRNDIVPRLPDDLIVITEEKWGSVQCLPIHRPECPSNPVLAVVNREFYPDTIKLEYYNDTLVDRVERIAEYYG